MIGYTAYAQAQLAIAQAMASSLQAQFEADMQDAILRACAKANCSATFTKVAPDETIIEIDAEVIPNEVHKEVKLLMGKPYNP